MNWLLVFLIGYFGAIHALPLPGDRLVELDDYTVLYMGPFGSHHQSGEPGRHVKGIYTFLDSNGRKQQVTYEADARGYRVKTVAAGSQSSSLQVPEIKTEVKSVRFVLRDFQEHRKQELKAEVQKIESNPKTKDEDRPEPKGETKPDQQEIVSRKHSIESIPDHQKEHTPVAVELPKVLLEPPPEFKATVKPASGTKNETNFSDSQKLAAQGTIKFKDPRSLQISEDLGYFIGFPFMPGNYVYAL